MCVRDEEDEPKRRLDPKSATLSHPPSLSDPSSPFPAQRKKEPITITDLRVPGARVHVARDHAVRGVQPPQVRLVAVCRNRFVVH